ncbi:hypothetical protein C8F04DRAFT_1195524 [Mycena alexandri]|uniref:Uncharacterized protein n=1 Tax=Mycena alexandri TaxID=1745969 RepID=A0AAD6WQG4_9AGAR|nr:hypothetical protein C8F04DRAFT_1195524 [Mycena alexandri]
MLPPSLFAGLGATAITLTTRSIEDLRRHERVLQNLGVNLRPLWWMEREEGIHVRLIRVRVLTKGCADTARREVAQLEGPGDLDVKLEVPGQLCAEWLESKVLGREVGGRERNVGINEHPRVIAPLIAHGPSAEFETLV